MTAICMRLIMRKSCVAWVTLLLACGSSSDGGGPAASGQGGSAGGAGTWSMQGANAGAGSSAMHEAGVGGAAGASGAAGSSASDAGTGGALPPAPCVEKVLTGATSPVMPADFAALQGVTEIAGDLTIDRSMVTDLGMLSCLRKVGGALTITNNAALTTLHGLEALTDVTSWVDVNDNDALVDASALERLTHLGANAIAPYLSISRNRALERIAVGSEVTGSLTIESNSVLSSLAGLKKLERVGLHLSLGYLPLVTTLADLSALTSVGKLSIFGNEQLPTCEAQVLADRLKTGGFTGEVYISDNGSEGTCP